MPYLANGAKPTHDWHQFACELKKKELGLRKIHTNLYQELSRYDMIRLALHSSMQQYADYQPVWPHFDYGDKKYKYNMTCYSDLTSRQHMPERNHLKVLDPNNKSFSYTDVITSYTLLVCAIYLFFFVWTWGPFPLCSGAEPALQWLFEREGDQSLEAPPQGLQNIQAPQVMTSPSQVPSARRAVGVAGILKREQEIAARNDRYSSFTTWIATLPVRIGLFFPGP